MDTPLRHFLEIPYEQLEEMNLAAKADRVAGKDPGKIREARTKYLTDEKRIKAVTVCFTDLEGRFHMLDYDKKFLLKSADNLTFDGSSIRGFSRQAESDLRLAIDWPAFYHLPADVFGPGKVLVFGDVCDQDGTPYEADLRARLKAFAAELKKKNMVAHVRRPVLVADLAERQHLARTEDVGGQPVERRPVDGQAQVRLGLLREAAD